VKSAILAFLGYAASQVVEDITAMHRFRIDNQNELMYLAHFMIQN
jgi:hypothetical protein